MLRIIRIILALFFFLGITFLLIDVSGLLHHSLGWMAHLQLLPAVLSFNILIVAILMVLTLLFGRIYCSIVCPMGVLQDIFNRLGRPLFKKRRHFSKDRKGLRYTVMSLFIVLLAAGLNQIAMLIAPYSAYGRVAATLLQPLYAGANNLLALWSSHGGHSLFYEVPVVWRGGVAAMVAVVTLVVIGALSSRYGRLWCNTVCPVGTLLGIVSRFSLFRVVLDAGRCKHCNRCAGNCKSMCIDIGHHQIDHSRCVVCMDCLDQCKFGALRYKFTGLKPDAGRPVSRSSGDDAPSRRRFLATSVLLAAGAATAASAKVVDGGLALIEEKRPPLRKTPVKPFGSLSQRHFSSHCTSCMLCVSQCPQHLLQPSRRFESLLQPEMQFGQGFCPPACTRCSQLCPTGAIRPVTPEQKTSISVGYAVLVPDNCISNTRGVNCTACYRHCPAGAIHMVRNQGGRLIPSVDENRCLGCGACEYYCPSRPFSAIYVEGRDTHTLI
ncbi:MAG: ferredoxin-type protein [bacterium F082]|nr:MAG: ferredoxin-type protein [bacterium F082]KWW27769.1 MAG: ferredoxin-type protein [bacterium P201]